MEEELAIAKWADENSPELYVPWTSFAHPQLGPVEIGGPNHFQLFTNPPLSFLKKAITGHADFAIYQAMMSPKLEILLAKADIVGPVGEDFIWKITIGVANTGFLPTNVSAMATKIKSALPVSVEICAVPEGHLASLDGSPLRIRLDQLAGRLSTRVKCSEKTR